jgi:ComF family protein
LIYNKFQLLAISRRLQRAASTLLGEPCLICQGLEGVDRGICERCLDSLPWQAPGCRRCGVVSETHDQQEPLCHRCRCHPPPFDRCFAVFAYEQPISRQIALFKDNGAFQVGRGLGRLLADSMSAHYQVDATSMPELLLPVPLHTGRLRMRGFNQASILAHCSGRRLGVQVVHQACQRLPGKHTQRGLDLQARLANLGRLFTENESSRLTYGKHVAIIDDVVTTTTTTRDMARVLRDAGARRIDVWALAQRNLTLSDNHTYEL